MADNYRLELKFHFRLGVMDFKAEFNGSDIELEHHFHKLRQMNASGVIAVKNRVHFAHALRGKRFLAYTEHSLR